MKSTKLLVILTTAFMINSCSRDSQNITPQSPTNNQSPLIADYLHTNNSTDFLVTGNCFTGNISWLGPGESSIFEQNGQYWIDTLNYVIKCPLPITPTSGSAFTFNDYYLPTPYTYRVTGGSGYVLNDTLIISVNGYNTNSQSCTDPFVFHGKYAKQ